MKNPADASNQQIEQGLKTAARLVDQLGDNYWPVFERLEHELELRQSRAERLKRRL